MLYHASVPGWRRRLRLPLELLKALRRARRWHPVPIFYAAVGGIALVPAVAIAALTPVRRWVALVGVPVAGMAWAFLWSLASAAGRGRRDVLWELAPERAWQRELEDELADVRAQIGGFQLLVPDVWPGELSLDGASWSIPPRGPRVLQDVMVVADQGDPLLDTDRHAPGWRPSTPRVEIRCTREAWGVAEAQALDEFVERAVSACAPNLDGAEKVDQREVERQMLAAHQDHEQARRRWEAELSDRWRDGRMLVDGAETTARLLTHGDADVAIATFVRDGQPIMVIATGIDLDTLALVGVADPTPLVDEFELRRRRMFTPSGG